MIQALRDAQQWWNDFTADVFWDIATSYPTLVLIGVVMIALFVIGHLPLIGKLIPAVEPYIAAAAIGSTIAAAALLFLIGFRVADQRDEAASLRRELNFSNLQLESMTATAKDATRLKDEADANRKATSDQLNAWREKYGDNPDAACRYPREFLDWLRNRPGKRAGASENRDRPRLRGAGGECAGPGDFAIDQSVARHRAFCGKAG